MELNHLGLGNISISDLATAIADAVVNALEKRGVLAKPSNANNTKACGISEKSAYAKTESLLYNYNGFVKIVEERQREIEELRVHGVPQRSGSIVEYTPSNGTVGQIVLPEESVESAVRTVQDSVQGTVQVIALIDKCMAALKNDPYYRVLEMRYFEGRTQEDIALEFGCSQVTISKNKSRLVRELSMRLFPNQVVKEMLN